MNNSESTLAHKAIAGVKWTSLSQVGKQIVQYTTTLLLAILLDPKDFGVIALAYMIIGFLELFKDLGSSSVIIYLDDINEKILSSLFWMNLLFGISIFTIVFFSAPYLSQFFNSPKLLNVLKILSFIFIISSLSIVQKAILEKSFRFAKLAKVEAASVFLGAISAIVSALSGLGVWSLVIQAITVNVILTITYWFTSSWYPKFLFNKMAIKSVLNYSLNLTGFNIFNYFVRNADYFLIGKFLDETALGHYFLAYKIMLYPLQNISAVVSRVMFPVYSKLKSDSLKFRDVYTKTSKMIAIVAFPIMIFILVFSSEIANTFFLSKWNTTLLSNLLLVLAPVGIVQSIASTTGSIYQANGKTDWMFRWGIFSSFLYLTGFIIGINYGVIGVATSYLIVTYMLLYPVFKIPFKLINYMFTDFVSKIKTPIIANIILLILLEILGSTAHYLLLNNVYILIFSFIGGVSFYVIFIWKFENKLISYFIKGIAK